MSRDLGAGGNPERNDMTLVEHADPALMAINAYRRARADRDQAHAELDALEAQGGAKDEHEVEATTKAFAASDRLDTAEDAAMSSRPTTREGAVALAELAAVIMGERRDGSLARDHEDHAAQLFRTLASALVRFA